MLTDKRIGSNFQMTLKIQAYREYPVAWWPSSKMRSGMSLSLKMM